MNTIINPIQVAQELMEITDQLATLEPPSHQLIIYHVDVSPIYKGNKVISLIGVLALKDGKFYRRFYLNHLLNNDLEQQVTEGLTRDDDPMDEELSHHYMDYLNQYYHFENGRYYKK